MNFPFLHIVSFPLFLGLLGCGSSPKLQKFNRDDLSKEATQELAQKFEVQDLKPVESVSVQAEKKIPSKKLSVKSSRGKSPAKLVVKSSPPQRRPQVFPIKKDQTLIYDIRYTGVTAGYFTVKLENDKEVNGRRVHHLTAHAKTVKLFELIYRVDDRIESFWDFDGLFSHRYTMNLDESKQSRRVVELYDYDRLKSFYWNRVDHVQKGFSEQKEEHDILPWSQDPLSALFYFRMGFFPQDPGLESKVPVIVDGKQWIAFVKFDRKEKIYTAGKDFNANVYRIVTTKDGEVKTKENQVWVSDDEDRHVLRIETKVRVGYFAVALDEIK